METFKIEIREYLAKILEIEAESSEEALLKVKEMYRNKQIILTENEYITTEIDEYIE